MAEPGLHGVPTMSAEVRMPSQRGTLTRPENRPTWRERVGTLFPADVVRPVRWYWLTAAVLLGALVSLGRGPGVLRVLDTVWAEDGSAYLTDVLNHNPAWTVVRPLNGYFVVVPRLLALPTRLVPVEWGPAVLTVEAALVTSLMAVAVYVVSRSYLRHPLARLVAAAPVLAVPVGANIAAEASNNVATLQFAAVYLALWLVLWVPARRGAAVAAALAVVAVAATTFLAAVLIPLALLRLYARRDRYSIVMVGGLLLMLAANLTVLAVGWTARPVILPSRWDPVWAVSTVVDWALPHALFGYRISGNGAQAVDPAWLVWVAWPIVVVILLLAVTRQTRPQWKLAAVLGTTALALVGATIMQYGGTELRYVIASELMLFAALAALLLPRPLASGGYRRRRFLVLAPLVALSVGLVLVMASSYRTTGPRASLASWSTAVDQARVACATATTGAVYVYPRTGAVTPVPHGTPPPNIPPPGFPVLIPCTHLR